MPYSVIIESSQFEGSTVTSAWDYYNTRSRLIDGDFTSNAGWSSGQGNTFPLPVQIQFPGPRLVNSVTLVSVRDSDDGQPAAYGESFSLHGVTDFQVHVLIDNGWVQVGEVTENTWVTRTVMFAPITTQLVKVTINGAMSDTGLRQIMAGVAYFNAGNGYAPQIWPLPAMLNYALAVPDVRVTGEDMGFETMEEATAAYNAAQEQLAINQQIQAANGIATLPKVSVRIQPARVGSMIPIAWYSGPVAIGVWTPLDELLSDALNAMVGKYIDVIGNIVLDSTSISTALMCYDPAPWFTRNEANLTHYREIITGVVSDYVIEPIFNWNSEHSQYGQLFRSAPDSQGQGAYDFMFQQPGPTLGGGRIMRP